MRNIPARNKRMRKSRGQCGFLEMEWNSMKDKREAGASKLYEQSRFKHRLLARWVIPLAIQLLTRHIPGVFDCFAFVCTRDFRLHAASAHGPTNSAPGETLINPR